MADPKLIPDMSTPEGIEQAFEHVRTHSGGEEHGEAELIDLMRVVDLEILRILEEAGVEDASSLEDELKRTTSGTVEEVAAAYTQDQGATLSGDEHVDLKAVAGLGYAVSAITAAVIAGAQGNGDEGALNLAGAREKMEELGSDEEAEATKQALGAIIDDMFTVLPVAE